MPNWCSNYLQIKGDPQQVADLLDGFANADSDSDSVDFLAKHAPLSSGDWDYSTAIDEWGTKWDLSNFHAGYTSGDTGALVRFESAWAPPVEGIRRVSEKFPLLVFGMSWMENGMCFYGYAAFLKGKTFGLFDGEIPDFYEQAAVKLGKPTNPTDHDDPEIWDMANDLEHDLYIKIDDLAEEQMKLAQMFAYHNSIAIPVEGD
jgi:hypothetical protein